MALLTLILKYMTIRKYDGGDRNPKPDQLI